MPLKLLNWNVEWAAAKWKAAELQRRIGQHAADIVCLTETDTARLALPPDDHSICAQANWGQPFRKGQEGRRKVLLWSRECWKAVDAVGHVSLPPGRFVSGVTQTSVGEVTVIGVCIPYSGSRVGPLWNRKMWQDHQEYLAGLAGLLKRASRARLVVVGDFNQRIGQRSSTPLRLRAALQSTLGPNLPTATISLGLQGRRTIDHIALSEDLVAESLGVISNVHQDGDLSDHFAVVAGLRRSLWSWRRGPRTAWRDSPPPVTWASRDRSPPTWASTAGLRSLPERVRGRCRMPGSSRNGYADCRRAGANGPTIHAATRRCTSSSEHCPRPVLRPCWFRSTWRPPVCWFRSTSAGATAPYIHDPSVKSPSPGVQPLPPVRMGLFP